MKLKVSSVASTEERHCLSTQKARLDRHAKTRHSIVSKYTDLPVLSLYFLLKSDRKYWQKFENTEKFDILCNI